MADTHRLKRYDLFGWDYEALNRLTDDETAWHEGWARRTGGPLLELACGTGRLLCRLALAGFDVTGVDLSETMLRLARRNVAALPAEARKRTHLVHADMADFHVEGCFRLVYIADNSLRELPTRDLLRQCLACARTHLAPGGLLLVTERRIDPSLYRDGRRVLDWSEPRRHPETGEMLSRRVELRLAPDRRSVSGMFHYKTTHADGTETVEPCPFEAPVLEREEYLALFAEAGFSARLFVDYKETSPGRKVPLWCFVCGPKHQAVETGPSCSCEGCMCD